MSRRVRGGQPAAGDIKHTSSASSLSSGRIERPTRSSLRQEESMTKSLTPQSSSDDAEGLGKSEPEARQTRLQRRGTGNLDATEEKMEEEDADDEDADGEVTRCVCGKSDYPGPPVPLVEGSRGHHARDSQRLASIAAAEGLPEDAGGLFIQCDTCHVWQHGGCVGIMEESATPENYYCEQCRTDLHKVLTGARGQRYSRYLPIVEPASTRTPRRTSTHEDGNSRSSKEADSRPALANMSSAKRRSTMNSRAAFDEEEMIRKAIEESKGDGPAASGGNGQRKSKRARDDESDGVKNDTKKRKTGSESQSPPAQGVDNLGPGSDDDAQGSRSRSGQPSKKSRTAAAQVLREQELREREIEKEQEKAEAANRRKGRAERRRADESEAPEEPVRPNVTSRSAATAKVRPPPPTKQPVANPTSAVSASHKKKPITRRSRVGRNQYTKDRESAQEKKDSPRASHSRGSDDAGNIQEGNGATMLSNGSKPSKPRHMNPNRTSMNDLRKRAAGILEYITRTQVEMAGQTTPRGKESNGSSTTPPAKAKVAGPNGASKLSTRVDGADGERKEGIPGVDEAAFQEMSSLEMMDVLTRELVLWQKDYGKYGEKS